MNGLRIPTATYRLQFRPGFGFDQARKLIPYLDALGITDVYVSPILRTRSGSIHGYDVTDHAMVNPELGGEETLRAFGQELRRAGMGMIVDVVPNHMEIDDPANRWWQDVLENGPSSRYAHCFDIDWTPPKNDLQYRVLLPVLGDQFGRVLDAGQIRLFYESGAFFIAYFDHRFPVDPGTAATVLETVAEHVRFTSDPEDPELIELESILTGLRHLPDRTTSDPDLLAERRREVRVARRRLNTLAESSAAVRRAIEGVVVDWSGRQGDSESFARLEQLLARQAYRLCHWRVAADEINYRRFFDVNDLAAIRVEDPAVFEAVHEVVLRLVGEGLVSGLRIDHPDGLYDPEAYFAQLQHECRKALPAGESNSMLGAAGSETSIYIVAEKILSRNEQLPMTWAVHGTTGYEMLNLINGLFVDPRAKRPLYTYYAQLCPDFYLSQPKEESAPSQSDQPSGKLYEDLVYTCKKTILKVSMSSELHVLARRLDRVSEQHRWSRDFTLWGLHEALREVIACFPVYRTYVQSATTEVGTEDRRHVEYAVAEAIRRNPAIDRSIFEFIESVLLLQSPEGLSDADRSERREFVMKLQQLTGPVMAKGLEDTAFYRVYPLASHNEVGGEPEKFSIPLDEFHRQNTVRCARWPYSMITTSTHDTKRSEDVRAWINAISEFPKPWVEAVERWRKLNRSKKAAVDGHPIPDSNEEYLLYQTLVGTWPLAPLSDAGHMNYVERIVAYMEKALREAKVHTSWISPNLEYEMGVARFVRAILDRSTHGEFLKDLEQFHRSISHAGLVNALGQLVLKMTIPGIPDFYQGCELWNFCLVDPDNRQAVDFSLRQKRLAELRKAEEKLDRQRLVDELLTNWTDGRIKLYVTYRGLQLRRQHREVFLEGEYLVPEVQGDRRDHVCAFIRRAGSKAVLVVVPRFTGRLAGEGQLPIGKGVWEETRLITPDGIAARWQNIFTGQEVRPTNASSKAYLPIADLLPQLPVGIYESGS